MTLRALQHIIRAAQALAEDCEFLGSHALDPHDLAAVKLLVGRSKDLALLRALHAQSLISPETLRRRIDLLEIPVEARPRLLANFNMTFDPGVSRDPTNR